MNLLANSLKILTIALLLNGAEADAAPRTLKMTHDAATLQIIQSFTKSVAVSGLDKKKDALLISRIESLESAPLAIFLRFRDLYNFAYQNIVSGEDPRKSQESLRYAENELRIRLADTNTLRSMRLAACPSSVELPALREGLAKDLTTLRANEKKYSGTKQKIAITSMMIEDLNKNCSAVIGEETKEKSKH